MLLAIDVGNSNTSVGLFDRDKQLRFLASLDTDSRKTADQISIDLMNLFALYHFRFEDVTGAILCSVVPPLNFMMEKALSRLLGKPPMVVGPGVRTGLNIRLAVQSQGRTSWPTRWRRWRNSSLLSSPSTWAPPPPSASSPRAGITRAGCCCRGSTYPWTL